MRRGHKSVLHYVNITALPALTLHIDIGCFDDFFMSFY